MQAVLLERFGPPEVLCPMSCEDPAAAPGWVVIELRAAALNWHDVLVRQGVYGSPLPHVLGADAAGVRRDTGEEVIVLPSLWWGDREAAPGPDWEILGDRLRGTYAELLRVPEGCLAPKPRNLTWQEAAALPLASLTAHRALFARGGLRGGETALVLGAGGGVSTAAVSLAHLARARVLVTSSTPEKIARARELGADGGALYTAKDWPEQIRALTLGGAGVDLVLDSVGSTWPQSLQALRPGGRVIALGATGGAEVQLDVRRFYFGQFSLLGTTMGSPRDFASLLALLDANPGFAPVVDSCWPLNNAADAHRAMERDEHFGKLTLSIA